MLIDKDLIKREDALNCIKKLYAGHTACNMFEALDAVAEYIEELPSAERIVAHIQDFTKYQIDWLTEHDDLELEPELESWVIRFLQDTASCYDKEYLISAERKGEWLPYCFQNLACSECGYIIADSDANEFNFCPNCGARMKGEEE